VAETGINKII